VFGAGGQGRSRVDLPVPPGYVVEPEDGVGAVAVIRRCLGNFEAESAKFAGLREVLRRDRDLFPIRAARLFGRVVTLVLPARTALESVLAMATALSAWAVAPLTRVVFEVHDADAFQFEVAAVVEELEHVGLWEAVRITHQRFAAEARQQPTAWSAVADTELVCAAQAGVIFQWREHDTLQPPQASPLVTIRCLGAGAAGEHDPSTFVGSDLGFTTASLTRTRSELCAAIPLDAAEPLDLVPRRLCYG